jgi:AraC-like DNA-binding protein
MLTSRSQRSLPMPVCRAPTSAVLIEKYSPHAWLRQHRLEQAIRMLRDTDKSIVSIAAALGYSSQTAFAAAFKWLTGASQAIGGVRRR